MNKSKSFRSISLNSMNMFHRLKNSDLPFPLSKWLIRGKRGGNRHNDARSVQHCAKCRDLAPDTLVAWYEFERSLELFDRLEQLTALRVDPSQVNEREVARLVARGLLGALQPGDGLVELIAVHQVHADIVVWIAEIRIDLDSLTAKLDRLVELALVAERPAQVGISFGGGEHFDRVAIKLDRAVGLPVLLRAQAFVYERLGFLQFCPVIHHLLLRFSCTCRPVNAAFLSMDGALSIAQSSSFLIIHCVVAREVKKNGSGQSTAYRSFFILLVRFGRRNELRDLRQRAGYVSGLPIDSAAVRAAGEFVVAGEYERRNAPGDEVAFQFPQRFVACGAARESMRERIERTARKDFVQLFAEQIGGEEDYVGRSAQALVACNHHAAFVATAL